MADPAVDSEAAVRAFVDARRDDLVDFAQADRDGEPEPAGDGSISIPILEEELAVTKRTVVGERIVIRKRMVTERETVEAELRRERVEVDVDGERLLVDEEQ